MARVRRSILRSHALGRQANGGNSAGVDHLGHPGLASGTQDDRRTFDVGPVDQCRVQAPEGVDCGAVVYPFATVHRSEHRFPIQDVAWDRLDSGILDC